MGSERTQLLIRVNGKPFRCDCECNVFHDAEPYNGVRVIKCNACGAEYTDDKPHPPTTTERGE